MGEGATCAVSHSPRSTRPADSTGEASPEIATKADYAPVNDPLAVRRCWLAKAKRVCSPGEGKGDGSLLRPNLLPVGAFGKDHVTRASNFDSGEQDAAEVVHRLAPSGSMSLFLDTLAGLTARPGFGVGPRIGWVRGDWCWLLCDA
jgi:hypothetical protein